MRTILMLIIFIAFCLYGCNNDQAANINNTYADTAVAMTGPPPPYTPPAMSTSGYSTKTDEEITDSVLQDKLKDLLSDAVKEVLDEARSHYEAHNYSAARQEWDAVDERLTKAGRSGTPAEKLQATRLKARYGKQMQQLNVDITVAEIGNDEHGTLPQMTSTGNSHSSVSEILIKNDTQYSLTIYYSGPSSKSVTVSPNGTSHVSLTSGAYSVAASVSASDVTNFYGSENLSGDYEVSYYIRTRTTY